MEGSTTPLLETPLKSADGASAPYVSEEGTGKQLRKEMQLEEKLNCLDRLST
jgi:hypothetical protein